MDSQTQWTLQFLEEDIVDWEQAAEFFEKYTAQVTEWGAGPTPQTYTAKEISEMYRRMIGKRKELIEKIKKEVRMTEKKAATPKLRKVSEHAAKTQKELNKRPNVKAGGVDPFIKKASGKRPNDPAIPEPTRQALLSTSLSVAPGIPRR